MNLDIKQLGLDILRDIYGSSRRLTLYPLGHPITQETLKKPLAGLNRLFSFKHSFTIDLFRDRLLAEGVLLDDTIFITGFSLEMKRHKLSNVVLKSSLGIGDLYHFLSLLSAKPGPFEDQMTRALQTKNIISVEVNRANPPRLYHFDDAGRVGHIGFQLPERVEEIIAEKPSLIASYYMGRLKSDDDVERELGVDLRLSFLTGYFREVLVHLGKEEALALIEEAILSTDWLDDSGDSQAIIGLKRLFENYLSENTDEAVLASIYALLKKVGAPEFLLNQALNKSSFLKIKTFQESESVIEALKRGEPDTIDSSNLKKTVFKLAASRQNLFLNNMMAQLIYSLSSPDRTLRQEAVRLVEASAEVLANGGFFDDYNRICKEVVRLALSPGGAEEPVELIANLIWLATKNSRWQEFKVLIRTLRGICEAPSQEEGKRSLAGSKISEISGSDTLYKIASELSEQNKTEANDFFEGLSAIGSTDVIRMLAAKITHPDINVRSRMVKLLVSMKRDAGDVLLGMLREMIDRIAGGEVSEADWHYFRNILRVLKEIKAGEALPYLEMMAAWPDTRLRLEIVKTLEGMPPESSCCLLSRLSKDESYEVKKASVAAMGLSGDSCMIHYLREVFEREPDLRHLVVASIGRIGGPKARDLLIELFEADELYRDLGISRRDEDDIKTTVLKALATIGDEIAMAKLAEYSQKQDNKSIFKKDTLSNTAKVILYGKPK